MAPFTARDLACAPARSLARPFPRSHSRGGLSESLRAGESHRPFEAPLVTGGRFHPPELMERVSHFLETEDESASLNASKLAVTGSNPHIVAAVDVLLPEGYIERERDGQRLRHRSLRPYRELTDLVGQL